MTEVQNGRRPRRVVLVAAAAGLLVPLTAVAVTSGMFDAKTSAAAQADDPTGCHAVPLPVPDGTTSEVVGGDPTGRYLVGHVTYPDGRRVGALWRDGQYSEIDASSLEGVQVDYHDVNSNGVVVGERMTDHSSFRTEAFTYQDGKFTFLPTRSPEDSNQALGINARGDVVGNDTASGWTPILWPADEPGTVRELPMPAGHQGDGLAVDIDEDGAVVGHLSPYPPGTPYLWPAEGQPSPLMVPAGSMGGSVSAVEGGMAAGSVYDPVTNATVPAVWDLRTGGLTLHKDVRAGALSVNSKGTIGTNGSLVHADSRVARVSHGTGTVNTVSDTDVAAGTTGEPDAQAMRWAGC